MQVLIWIFVCVLIPLVGVNYASRMILLCLLPAGVGERLRNLPGDLSVN
jgi:hypothetical protein